MIEEPQVRQKLREVAHSDFDVFAFEEWLEDKSRNMFSDSSPEAIDLVSNLNRLFAEYYRHALNEDELHDELSSLAQGFNRIQLGFVNLVSAAEPTHSLFAAVTV